MLPRPKVGRQRESKKQNQNCNRGSLDTVLVSDAGVRSTKQHVVYKNIDRAAASGAAGSVHLQCEREA